MILEESEYLEHIGRSVKDGAPVGSGRYPLGSGDNPYQNFRDFRARNAQLKKQGLSQKEICRYFGMTMDQYRETVTIAKENVNQHDYLEGVKLRDKGWSYAAIAKKQGRSVSGVRKLLNRVETAKENAVNNTAELLRESLDLKGGFIDVGAGAELEIGVSRSKLEAAVRQLQEDGYSVGTLSIRQVFGQGNTTIKYLAPPGTTKGTVYNNTDQLRAPVDIHVDRDGNKQTLRPIENVSAKRVMVNYAEDGGIQKDGVIEIRRGVKDLDLGAAHYAQVRIGVDGTHYLKGMAVYADDLPDGIDIRFNTNKHRGTPMIASEPGGKEVLKPMQDPKNLTNPFGASIKPGGQRGALNIVNEEGDWREWSKTLASQFLSKQSGTLARRQLKLSVDIAESEFSEIKSLTNPTLKRYYLQQFADACESDAVHLKAASLPRQATKVILPIPELKDNEIYAPTYRHGEQVALIRYPHGGTFEIPILTVNNRGVRGKIAEAVMGNAQDAVGINSKVAEKLSGADFDGDTVVVIPTSTAKIKSRDTLKGLENFDPKVQYNGDNMDPKDRLSKKRTQTEMGKVTNLITDMTIRNANDEDLAKAVRHSMVIIDAAKHNLDWKASERDNDILELKKRYQGVNEQGKVRGASTIVSQAKGRADVLDRREKAVSKLTPEERVRWEQGEVIWENTGKTYWSGRPAMQRITKMELYDDASVLSSGTMMEQYYVDYANSMKQLANKARAELRRTPRADWNRSAEKAYSAEVDSLNEKLQGALANAPRERRAQALANSTIKIELDEHPEYDDSQKRKCRSRHLEAARVATGSKKNLVKVTDREWDAIQAGAISDSKLLQILDNGDADALRQRAMPRGSKVSSAKISRAKSMLDRGYQWDEVASMLGVSVSTLQREIYPTPGS